MNKEKGKDRLYSSFILPPSSFEEHDMKKWLSSVEYIGTQLGEWFDARLNLRKSGARNEPSRPEGGCGDRGMVLRFWQRLDDPIHDTDH